MRKEGGINRVGKRINVVASATMVSDDVFVYKYTSVFSSVIPVCVFVSCPPPPRLVYMAEKRPHYPLCSLPSQSCDADGSSTVPKLDWTHFSCPSCWFCFSFHLDFSFSPVQSAAKALGVWASLFNVIRFVILKQTRLLCCLHLQTPCWVPLWLNSAKRVFALRWADGTVSGLCQSSCF